MKLNFSKVRDVKRPTIATNGSAGIDFYIPKFTNQFVASLMQCNKYDPFELIILDGKRTVRMNNNSKILIPSGIKVNLQDPNLILVAFNKSGIAAKHGLIVGSCVIDKDYQGQIHIHLINTTDRFINISQGQKIVQFLPFNFINIQLQQTNIDKLYIEQTDRGEDGFGSTDKK